MPAPTPIPVFDSGPVFGPVQSAGETSPALVNQFGLQTVTIDGYPIDAVVSEKHDFESEVTEYPVERGADITDNVRPKPFKISLDCFVSDTPFGPIAQHQTRQNGTPSFDAYARLMQLRDTPTPVTVVTSLRSYSDMVLSSLSFPRTSGEPAGLHFTVTFTKVLIVANIRVAVAAAVSGQTKRAAAVAYVDLGDLVTPVYFESKEEEEAPTGSESQVHANSFVQPPNYVGEDEENVYLEADEPETPPATGYWISSFTDLETLNARAFKSGDTQSAAKIKTWHVGYNPFGDTPIPSTTLRGRYAAPDGTPTVQDPGGTNFDVLEQMLQAPTQGG